MQTVVVKGRMFSVDDSQANEIERLCLITGTELHPPPGTPDEPVSKRRGKKEEDGE